MLHSTGHEPHLLFVERRVNVFEWRLRVSRADIERGLEHAGHR
jgi:hypothetical protein